MKKNTDGLTISVLERELGIGKDTLRVWERRYGFPNPTRDPKGERRYPPEQVARLRLVRRLLDQGMRPHQVLGLPDRELRERSASSAAAAMSAMPDPGPFHAEVRDLVKRHDALALQQALRTMLLREGLERFVLDTAGPLIAAIGSWWAAGQIEIFEEHLATEQLHRVLREAVSQVAATNGRPRVVITTLPQEPHALGLLLAEALLRLQGANCTPLGAQTPESQVLAAARAADADIVALSFSDYFALPPMRDAVAGLRQALPPKVELWCGGSGTARLKNAPAGVHVVTGLADIGAQLVRWGETSQKSPARARKA